MRLTRSSKIAAGKAKDYPKARAIHDRLLPCYGRLTLLRLIVGIATFFDAYTILAIAFAMPQLVTDWNLAPQAISANGTKRTWWDVRIESAFRGKAEVRPTGRQISL
jgi:hypothetical protein